MEHHGESTIDSTTTHSSSEEETNPLFTKRRRLTAGAGLSTKQRQRQDRHHRLQSDDCPKLVKKYKKKSALDLAHNNVLQARIAGVQLYEYVPPPPHHLSSAEDSPPGSPPGFLGESPLASQRVSPTSSPRGSPPGSPTSPVVYAVNVPQEDWTDLTPLPDMFPEDTPLNRLLKAFRDIHFTSNASDTGAEKFFNLIATNPDLRTLIGDGDVTHWPSYKWIIQGKFNQPTAGGDPIMVSITYKDNSRKVLVYKVSANVCRAFETPNYSKVICVASQTVKTLIRLHKLLNTRFIFNGYLDFAIDGVPKAKSSKTSLTVVVARHVGCSQWIVLRVIEDFKPSKVTEDLHPYDDNTEEERTDEEEGQYEYGDYQCEDADTGKLILSKMDHFAILENCIKECSPINIRLRLIITDAVEKCKILGLKGHSGYFSCSMCYIEGERAGPEGRKKTCFPLRRPIPDSRTKESHKLICDAIDEAKARGVDLDKKERKGVLLRTPLMKLDYMDPFKSCCVDPMHAAHLGVQRRLFDMHFFNIKTKVSTFHVADRIDIKVFDELYLKVKVFTEFRVTRPFSLPHWKALEYFFVQSFAFPIVTKCFNVLVQSKYIELFRLLAFLTRWAMFPQSWRDSQEHQFNYKKMLQDYQGNYLEAYGAYNCTFNVHSLIHWDLLLQYDNSGVMTAYGPEDSYGLLTRKVSTTSHSFAKMALIHQLRRHRCAHSCVKSITVNHYATEKFDDTLIYTHEEDGHQVRQVKVFRVQNNDLHEPPVGYQAVHEVFFIQRVSLHDTFKNKFYRWSLVRCYR